MLDATNDALLYHLHHAHKPGQADSDTDQDRRRLPEDEVVYIGDGLPWHTQSGKVNPQEPEDAADRETC